MTGTVADEILVVVGKAREHKAGYFDEIMALTLERAEERHRAAGRDPQRLDPRSGKPLRETEAINAVATAAGVDRTHARQWWGCRQAPDPEHRWRLIENLDLTEAHRRRLWDAAGLVRRADLVVAEPEPTTIQIERAAGPLVYWRDLQHVVRVTHETHNFTLDPTERAAARQRAVNVAELLTRTPDQGQLVALDAKADASIRLRELHEHPRDRTDAAIEAEALGSRLHRLTGDATRHVEALRIWALDLKNRRPDRAVEELEKMFALKDEAQLLEPFWVIAELDRLSVDVALRRRYWQEHLDDLASEIARLEERLVGVGVAWAGLISHRLLARTVRDAGDVERAVQQLRDTLRGYREMPEVGNYHLELIRGEIRDLERRQERRGERP